MNKARLAIAFVILASIAAFAHAEESVVLARGFKANSVFQFNEFDSVNTFNGNLVVTVPLGPAYKSNGSLSYQFSVNYNSHVWDFYYYEGVDYSFGIRRAVFEHFSNVVNTWDWHDSVPPYLQAPATKSSQQPSRNDVTSGTESVPHGNAGMGWNFSLGWFDGRSYTSQSGASSVFYPSMHAANSNVINQNPDTQYTNDGTYLRLRKISTNVREIDFPDGTRKRYTCVAQCSDLRPQWNLNWISDPYGNALVVTYSDLVPPNNGEWKWTLTEMTANNAEAPGTETQYYDGTNASMTVVRTHYAYFTKPETRPWETRLRKLALAASNGKFAIYELVYNNMILPTNVGVPWPNVSGLIAPYVVQNGVARRAASALAAIRLPDPAGTTTPDTGVAGTESAGVWQFRYYDDPNGGGPYDPTQPYVIAGIQYPASFNSGRLKVAKPPTGGGYRYEYAPRGYPIQSCSVTGPGQSHGVSFTGVSKRQQIDEREVDVPNAAWYYVGAGFLRTADLGGNCYSAKEFVSAVISPPNSDESQDTRISLAFFLLLSSSGFDRMGWPLTEQEMLCPSGAENCAGNPEAKYLSTRVVKGNYGTFASDPNNSVRRMFARYLWANETATPFTTVRSEWVRYTSSSDDCRGDGPGVECVSSNLRKTLGRDVFHDDAEAVTFVETALDGFDGLGHFRQSRTTANFQQTSVPNLPAADRTEDRVSITNWNPDVVYQGPTTDPPSGTPLPAAPWFLEKYDSTSVTENGKTFYKTFAFDPHRNYMTGSRTYVGTATPPAQSTSDVVATITRTGALHNNVPSVTVKQAWFGGDDHDFVQPTYEKETRWKYGAVENSAYTGCTTSGPFLTIEDATLDANTGLPTVLRDSTGAGTTYTYDALGRVISVMPASGVTAQVYSYQMATKGRLGTEGPAALNTYQDSKLQITRGASGPDVTYYFDPLGRHNRMEEKIPGSLIHETKLEYLSTSLVSQEMTRLPGISSTWAATKHAYDILDRKTKTTLPDNKFTEYRYNGNRTTSVIVDKVAVGDLGFSPVWTDQMYDGFGRLRRVNDNAARADYRYDAEDRLVGVDLAEAGNQSPPSQNRFFVYDGRGFLTSETHPELGPGTLHHDSIDALGHSKELRVANDSSKKLWFVYDKAERLIQVSGIPAGESHQTWLQQFVYHKQDGTTVPPGGSRAAGRLHKTFRRNFVPTPGLLTSTTVVQIGKTYGYDSAGRMSTVTLENAYNGVFAATTRYHYDDLDQVQKIDYPSIGAAPVRNVLQTFSRGRLTGLSTTGASNFSIASLTYHRNGLLAAVSRSRPLAGADPLEDRIDADPSGMLRPSRFSWQYMSPAPSQRLTSETGLYLYDGAGDIYKIGDDEYRYDTTFRLKKATIDSHSRTWNYDAYGNITGRPASNGVTLDVPTNPQSNRQTLLDYDTLGNVTEMPDYRPGVPGGTTARLKFQYDLLSSMTHFEGHNIGRIFLYDADGERVATLDYKATGGLRESWTLRGPGNQVLRDMVRSGGAWSWSKDYIYRGSTLSSTVGPGEALNDVHVDHLGSTRLVTEANGQGVPITITNGVGSQIFWDSVRKYWPFGEQTFSRALPERMTFTGHERDDDGTDSAEADVDYMHARYYMPAGGRFLSIDPGRDWDRLLPQSWNGYSYVRNNSLNAADPRGRETKMRIDSSDVEEAAEPSNLVVAEAKVNLTTKKGWGLVISLDLMTGTVGFKLGGKDNYFDIPFLKDWTRSGDHPSFEGQIDIDKASKSAADKGESSKADEPDSLSTPIFTIGPGEMSFGVQTKYATAKTGIKPAGIVTLFGIARVYAFQGMTDAMATQVEAEALAAQERKSPVECVPSHTPHY